MLSSNNNSASTSAYPSTYPSPQQWGGNSQEHQRQANAKQPHNSPSSFLSNPKSNPISYSQSPQSFSTAGSYPSPLPPANTPSSYSNSNNISASPPRLESDRGRELEGEGMERRGSGGVRINGGRVIEFGDFPERVRVEEARERVLRSWGEREREVERRKREMERGAVQRGGERVEGVGLGIRR